MTYINESLNNVPKRVKRKILHEVHYPIDKLYYAEIDGYECIVCEIFLNHKPKYKELITIPDYYVVDKILDKSFKIVKSLKEEIEEKQIGVCLLSKDGREKREVTIYEIINIIKVNTLLEKRSFDDLNNVCINMANQITDLLGININSNPSSTLKLSNVEEMAIPAIKVQKFKNLLFNYIKISIILDGNVSVSNKDYRVLRALKGAKIKTPEFENEFTIVGNSNGEISLECSNVVEGFQKPFKNVLFIK